MGAFFLEESKNLYLEAFVTILSNHSITSAQSVYVAYLAFIYRRFTSVKNQLKRWLFFHCLKSPQFQ